MSKIIRLAKIGNGPGDYWPPPLNKRNQSLVEAFMMAGEAAGDLGNRGKGGLAAHFKTVAVKHPRAFIRLWIQILLLQMTDAQEVPHTANEQHQASPHSRIQSVFEAILMTPEAVGDPSNRGKGGAAGYFKWLLAKHPLAYLSALEHILPLQMINEHWEQEYANIHEMLLERVTRLIEGAEREKREKSRADQDRLNATAP
jgi:hypothetical protein